MSFTDPYGAYAEGTLTSGGPLQLVIALYEKAIDCVRLAKSCLETGDIPGRSKAINKGLQILTELLVSLDHEKGGEISANLRRLYSYLQCRLLDAHSQQQKAPLIEAERLLNTMLEGWHGAARKMALESNVSTVDRGYPKTQGEEPVETAYGFFAEDVNEYACAGVSAMF